MFYMYNVAYEISEIMRDTRSKSGLHNSSIEIIEKYVRVLLILINACSKDVCIRNTTDVYERA